MNIETILSSPLINKAELARLVYPNDNFPAQRLKQKTECLYGQRLTESDKEKIRVVIQNLINGK